MAPCEVFISEKAINAVLLLLSVGLVKTPTRSYCVVPEETRCDLAVCALQSPGYSK